MHIKAPKDPTVHTPRTLLVFLFHPMASYYGIFVTIHLLCAITFIGAVFFEVLVIEPIEKRLPLGVGEQIAEAIPRRVRTFMPVVVALLYLTGGAMFWVHFSSRPDFFQSRFGLLLALKGTMDVCRFRHTHRIVAALMLGIVLLAKGMFYL